MTDRTILVVGSAPSYPHGVVDPIAEIAALAKERDILCHVDACLGGFFLPFLRRFGERAPAFDFAVPGVTSISADLHKYGYSARGASVILHRTRALRQHQFHAFSDWSGGLYGSPTMTGSRPGGPIAAAWALFHYLGVEGYVRLCREALEVTRRLIAGICAIPGLFVVGQPDMSIFAFSASTLDIYELCDRMEERGWRLERQQLPPSAHLMVTPSHARIVEPFLTDLADVAKRLSGSGPASAGAAAMYGMLGTMPDRGVVHELILDFLDGLDR